MSPEPATLLLVDDEPQIPRWLGPALRAAGYGLETANTGKAAIDHVSQRKFDLVLLDLGLPDIDGKEVIAHLRQWSDVPILVLSARDQEREKVEALDLGADDFVNKPIGIDELLARIRANLRRVAKRRLNEPTVQVGELKIAFALRRVWIEDQEVRLTPREYDLLKALAAGAGKVLTHSQIIEAVWGPEHSVEAQHVRVLMAQLRNKLEANPSNPQLLLTEPGVGYRLRSDDDGRP